MEGFKVDPAKYAGLTPEEKVRRIAEDERKHINEDPRLQAHIRDMDRRAAQEQEARERATIQHRNRQEREFGEAVDKHYAERMEFYRLSRGVPETTFRTELWPEIRRAFIAGEPDAVDLERWERSTDIY